MNGEAEGLVVPREQPSLEELEKKYFKKNANYYTNKQSDTNFDRFELSEKDMQVLRSQMGDEEDGIPSPKDGEALTTGTADNPVDVRQLRGDSLPAKRVWRPKINWRCSADSRESQVYLFIYLNFAIGMYSVCYHLYVNLTFSLFVCYFSRLVLFCWLKVLNSNAAVQVLHTQICGVRSRIFQVDLFVLLWPPIRQVIFALVFPHMNWSPINPQLNEDYSFLLPLMLVCNHFLMKRYFAAEVQD